MELPMRIRVARQRARLSQEMLAAQLGVTRGAVANWECAVGVLPATSRLERLACVTGVRFEWLATGRGPLAFDALPCEAPADAELVHDPVERRLLLAFRIAGRETRRLMLGLVDVQLASPQGRRSV